MNLKAEKKLKIDLKIQSMSIESLKFNFAMQWHIVNHLIVLMMNDMSDMYRMYYQLYQFMHVFLLLQAVRRLSVLVSEFEDKCWVGKGLVWWV